MTKNIRNLALATMSGFRHKTVDVPEWEGATVVLREPSAEAWLRWQEIVKAKDDETPLSVAERARRNLEADVELFIDVLCDTGLQPVFSEDDREQVIAVYQVSQGELSTLSEAQKKTLLQNAALIDQKKIREQLAAYESSLADSNASTRASNDAQLLGYGEGSRMRERLQEMWSKHLWSTAHAVGFNAFRFF